MKQIDNIAFRFPGYSWLSFTDGTEGLLKISSLLKSEDKYAKMILSKGLQDNYMENGGQLYWPDILVEVNVFGEKETLFYNISADEVAKHVSTKKSARDILMKHSVIIIDKSFPEIDINLVKITSPSPQEIIVESKFAQKKPSISERKVSGRSKRSKTKVKRRIKGLGQWTLSKSGNKVVLKGSSQKKSVAPKRESTGSSSLK